MDTNENCHIPKKRRLRKPRIRSTDSCSFQSDSDDNDGCGAAVQGEGNASPSVGKELFVRPMGKSAADVLPCTADDLLPPDDLQYSNARKPVESDSSDVFSDSCTASKARARARRSHTNGTEVIYGDGDVFCEAQFVEAVDWCFERIVAIESSMKTGSTAFERDVESARWDDELTRGGSRAFEDGFDSRATRALTAQQLPAATTELKAVVFLDYPNEVYSNEFLHLRVVDPRTRRHVLSNLLKCLAEQHQAACEYGRWLQAHKRLFITAEEKINKMFVLRMAEPRGLRKLNHCISRAEQCNLVGRSRGFVIKRSLSTETDCPPSERFCVTRWNQSETTNLFGDEDSFLSREDLYIDDDSSFSRMNSVDGSSKGWAGLKRTGSCRSVTAQNLRDSLHTDAAKQKARETKIRHWADREEEKKKARERALRQRWRDVQRLARHTHDGPRYHHPRREEHAKAQYFTTPTAVFSRHELVYISAPKELFGRPREALDHYLRQLPKMHKLAEEPHKLDLACKYGLITIDEKENALVSYGRISRPWCYEKSGARWTEFSISYGNSPWEFDEKLIPSSVLDKLQKTSAGAAKWVNSVACDEGRRVSASTAPSPLCSVSESFRRGETVQSVDISRTLPLSTSKETESSRRTNSEAREGTIHEQLGQQHSSNDPKSSLHQKIPTLTRYGGELPTHRQQDNAVCADDTGAMHSDTYLSQQINCEDLTKTQEVTADSNKCVYSNTPPGIALLGRDHEDDTRRRCGRKRNSEKQVSLEEKRGLRQAKLTDLLKFAVNKVRNKVKLVPSMSTQISSEDETAESDVFKRKVSRKRVRVVDDDARTDRMDNVVERVGGTTESGASQTCVVDFPPVAQSGNDVENTPVTDFSDLRDCGEHRKSTKTERKRRLRDIMRQLVEYEAEENDEELREDAEYRNAVAELRHRLEDDEVDEEDLPDSDNEFLEELMARPEDELHDEMVEDREAVQMKLKRDMVELEDEMYERMIGRYKRSGDKGGAELTEQEKFELELEERRRTEMRRRRKMGEDALEGFELDDWLSDSEEHSRNDSDTEINQDGEGTIERWSTLESVRFSTKQAHVPVSNNDRATQCRQNALRRQQMHQLRQRRQHACNLGSVRASDMGVSMKHRSIIGDRCSSKGRGGAYTVVSRPHQAIKQRPDSDDDLKPRSTGPSFPSHGLFLTSEVPADASTSCLRFDVQQETDFTESSTNSRTVGPVFTSFRASDRMKNSHERGESRGTGPYRKNKPPSNSSDTTSGFAGILSKIIPVQSTTLKRNLLRR